MVDKFINIFEGLKRAHGCTYINSVPKNGAKLKTKSFVKREIVTRQHFEDHLNGLLPSYENKHRVLHKDGTYRWVLDRGQYIEKNI